MKIKAALFGLALASQNVYGQVTAVPFQTVIPITVVCTKGGPGTLIKILLDKYNEQVRYGMRVATKHQDIQMFIAENASNPSSSLFLYNERLNQTCLFWSARDTLKSTPIEELPAKQPSETKTKA